MLKRDRVNKKENEVEIVEREKFDAVLSRCLDEINWAKFNRQILVEMNNCNIDYGNEIGSFWLATKHYIMIRWHGVLKC